MFVYFPHKPIQKKKHNTKKKKQFAGSKWRLQMTCRLNFIFNILMSTSTHCHAARGSSRNEHQQQPFFLFPYYPFVQYSLCSSSPWCCGCLSAMLGSDEQILCVFLCVWIHSYVYKRACMFAHTETYTRPCHSVRCHYSCHYAILMYISCDECDPVFFSSKDGSNAFTHTHYHKQACMCL